MNFCRLTCARLLRRFVFSESLPGRFARFLPNSVLGSGFLGLCAENFLHNLLGMLNASLRRFGEGTRVTRSAHALQSRKKSDAPESHTLWAFSSIRKNLVRGVAQSCCATY